MSVFRPAFQTIIPPQPAHAIFAHTGSLQFVQSAAPVPHIGTLSGAGGYSMPFHGDPKILAFCPGEVRHRKRTSRQQLNVLEEVFTTDQKPGPALRKKLALELEMTPRSVQVWFQNRRAKEKNLDKKKRAAIDQQGAQDSAEMDAEEDSDELERPTTASSSRTAPPTAAVAAPVPVTAPSPPSSEGSAPDIAMLRRGSAPAVITTTEPISPPAIIPLGPPDAARRQSLETASRLVSPPSSFRNVSRSQLSLSTRPSRLQHSVTAPMPTPSSIDRWVDQTAAANAAASTHAPRAPAPQNLAGPLPAADFSFGAPPAVDNAQQAATGGVADVDYPDNYSRNGSLVDTAASYRRHPSLAPHRSNSNLFLSQPRFSSIASSDDGSAPPMSRFASFASSASGASSSTYYSTLATPDGWSRRSSVAGEFSNMMGRLQVAQTSSFNPSTAVAGLYQEPVSQYDPAPTQYDSSSQYHHDSPPAASNYASPQSGYQGSLSGDWSSPGHSSGESTVDVQHQQPTIAQPQPSTYVSDLASALGMPQATEQRATQEQQPHQMYAPLRRLSVAPVEPGSLASAMGDSSLSCIDSRWTTSSHSSPSTHGSSPSSHGGMVTPPTHMLNTPAVHTMDMTHAPSSHVSVVVPEPSAYGQGYASQYTHGVVTPCQQQPYGLAVMQGDAMQQQQQQQSAHGIFMQPPQSTMAYSYYTHAQ